MIHTPTAATSLGRSQTANLVEASAGCDCSWPLELLKPRPNRRETALRHDVFEGPEPCRTRLDFSTPHGIAFVADLDNLRRRFHAVGCDTALAAPRALDEDAHGDGWAMTIRLVPGWTTIVTLASPVPTDLPIGITYFPAASATCAPLRSQASSTDFKAPVPLEKTL
jgi:hypothetical protein